MTERRHKYENDLRSKKLYLSSSENNILIYIYMYVRTYVRMYVCMYVYLNEIWTHDLCDTSEGNGLILTTA